MLAHRRGACKIFISPNKCLSGEWNAGRRGCQIGSATQDDHLFRPGGAALRQNVQIARLLRAPDDNPVDIEDIHPNYFFGYCLLAFEEILRILENRTGSME